MWGHEHEYEPRNRATRDPLRSPAKESLVRRQHLDKPGRAETVPEIAEAAGQLGSGAGPSHDAGCHSIGLDGAGNRCRTLCQVGLLGHDRPAFRLQSTALFEAPHAYAQGQRRRH